MDTNYSHLNLLAAVVVAAVSESKKAVSAIAAAIVGIGLLAARKRNPLFPLFPKWFCLILILLHLIGLL